MQEEVIISKKLRYGFVDLLILQLLTNRDMYGYEIAHELREKTNGVFDVKEATLYPPLYRMTASGWISTREGENRGKLKRTYYHLEASGRERLQEGIHELEHLFFGISSLIPMKGVAHDDEE